MPEPLPSYKEIGLSLKDYSFNCPVGPWRAQLVGKAWGKIRNIILFFDEVGTAKYYCVCVFNESWHKAEDGGIDFRYGGKVGEYFELETGKTRTGKTKLVAARIIASPVEPSADAQTPDTLMPVS